MILNRQHRVAVAIGPLSEFLERVRCELRFPKDAIAVQLVSDPAMAKLNRTFRGKHGSTDVLSFPTKPIRSRPAGLRRKYPRTREADEIHVGDIAIAPETARRNARLYSRSLPEELRILILHGMIHLAGFDHETDHGQMERLERRLRRRFGLGAS